MKTFKTWLHGTLVVFVHYNATDTMKLTDLKFTPGPLSVWGQQEHTVIEGLTMIGPDDKLTPHTAYIANGDDAILYSRSPDLLAALVEARQALIDCTSYLRAHDHLGIQAQKTGEQTLDKINKLLDS